MDDTAKHRALVVFDLDGTTLSRGATGLTARVHAALSRAHGRGCAVAVATGRAECIVPLSIRTMPALDYLITSNGARLTRRRGGACLFRGELTGETVLGLMAEQRPLGAAFNLFLHGRALLEEGAVAHMLDGGCPPELRAQVEAELRGNAEIVPDLTEVLRSGVPGVEKLGCSYATEAALSTALRDLERRSDLEAVLVDGNQIEITAAGVHKGAAVARLAGLLSLPPARILAFGDSNNDLSMAAVARLVAMENGLPAVKAAAHAVTASVEEDGVALYLERWLEEISHT